MIAQSSSDGFLKPILLQLTPQEALLSSAVLSSNCKPGFCEDDSTLPQSFHAYQRKKIFDRQLCQTKDLA